jgi:hypothetical protein
MRYAIGLLAGLLLADSETQTAIEPYDGIHIQFRPALPFMSFTDGYRDRDRVEF